MNENLKEALSKLAEMPEVQEKLKNAGSPDAVYEILQSVQSGYTLDELKAAMEELQAKELSDEELDSVAGGWCHYIMLRLSDQADNSRPVHTLFSDDRQDGDKNGKPKGLFF